MMELNAAASVRSALLLETVPEVSDALAAQLGALFPGVAVHRADSLQQARQITATGTSVDLALIDLQIPDGSGVDWIDGLLAMHPACVIAITTLYADDEYLLPALCAGARGYLLKDASPQQNAAALRSMVHGEPVLSPSIARRLLNAFTTSSADLELTTQERGILMQLSKGYVLHEVAERLDLDRQRIGTALSAIYRKLDATRKHHQQPPPS